MNKALTVGTAEIISLGIADMDRTADEIADTFPEVDREELEPALVEAYGNRIIWSFNAALVRFAGKDILVDTGFGFSSGGPGASTASLLAEVGADPAAIAAVVITHGHGDHVGGLLDGEKASFPNAELVVSGPEYRHLMSGDTDSPQRRGFAAYAERLRIIEPDGLIAGGDGGDRVQAIDAPGHTPGHIGLEVVSAGKRAWLLVDTAHSLIQMRIPGWCPRYDMAPDTARKTRIKLFEQAADEEIPVLMYHFPFPGFGDIERSVGAFLFRPKYNR